MEKESREVPVQMLLQRAEQKKNCMNDKVQIYSVENVEGILETVTNLVLKCLSWW